jgi:hypothetical protein
MGNIKVKEYKNISKYPITTPRKTRKQSNECKQLFSQVSDLKEAIDQDIVALYPYYSSGKRPKVPANIELGKDAKGNNIVATHGCYWENVPALEQIQDNKNFSIIVGYDPHNNGHMGVLDIDGFKKYPTKQVKDKNGNVILEDNTAYWYDDELHKKSCTLLYEILKDLPIDTIPVQSWSGGYHLWFRTKESVLTSEVLELQCLKYPKNWEIKELRGTYINHEGTDQVEVLTRGHEKKVIIPPSQVSATSLKYDPEGKTKDNETRHGMYKFINTTNTICGLDLVDGIGKLLKKAFVKAGFEFDNKKYKELQQSALKDEAQNKRYTKKSQRSKNASTIPVSNKQIQEIIDNARKCYHPGKKHEWSMRLCGMLRRGGYSKEVAKEIVTALEPNDQPMLDRLDRAYGRSLKGGVNGWYEFEKWTSICCKPKSEIEDVLKFFRKVFNKAIKRSKYDVRINTILRGYGEVLGDDHGVYFPLDDLKGNKYYLRIACPNGKQFTHQWGTMNVVKDNETNMTTSLFTPKGNMLRKKMPMTEDDIATSKGHERNSQLSKRAIDIGIVIDKGGFINFFNAISDMLRDYDGLNILKINPQDRVQEQYEPLDRINSKLNKGHNPSPKELADYLFELYKYEDDKGKVHDAFKINLKTRQYYMVSENEHKLVRITTDDIIDLINNNIGVNAVSTDIANEVLKQITDEVQIKYEYIEFEDGTLNTETHKFEENVFYTNILPKHKVPCKWDNTIDPTVEPEGNKVWDAIKRITYCTDKGFEDNTTVFLRGGGHLFMARNETQRAMLLIGAPKTGKSTLMAIFKYLLTYSEVRIPDIVKGERFTLEPCIGSCINIDDDMQNNKLSGIGRLNTFISGDGGQVERKHESARITLDTFTTPRLLGGANTVPIVLGEGFERRRLVIKCKNIIKECDRDNNFIGDIMQGKYHNEMAYVVHRMIWEYWQLNNKCIVSDAQDLAMAQEWEFKSYPVKSAIGMLFERNTNWTEPKDTMMDYKHVNALVRLWLEKKFKEGEILSEQLKVSNKQIVDAMGRSGYTKERHSFKVDGEYEKYEVYSQIKISEYGKGLMTESKNQLPLDQPWNTLKYTE